MHGNQDWKCCIVSPLHLWITSILFMCFGATIKWSRDSLNTKLQYLNTLIAEIVAKCSDTTCILQAENTFISWVELAEQRNKVLACCSEPHTIENLHNTYFRISPNIPWSLPWTVGDWSHRKSEHGLKNISWAQGNLLGVYRVHPSLNS